MLFLIQSLMLRCLLLMLFEWGQEIRLLNKYMWRRRPGDTVHHAYLKEGDGMLYKKSVCASSAWSGDMQGTTDTMAKMCSHCLFGWLGLPTPVGTPHPPVFAISKSDDDEQ